MPSGRYEGRPFGPDEACIKALKAQGLERRKSRIRSALTTDSKISRGGLSSNRAFLRSLRSFCLSRFDYLSFRTIFSH
jgi:hypothetical protein